MQVSGKLTREDLDDVRRLIQSKWYWPKLLASNWYGLILLCIIIWVTIEGLLGIAHPNWQGLLCVWAVVGGLVGWAFYRTKRARAKEFAQLDTTRPDWISFGNDGLNLDGPNGARSFRPWNNFTGYREGRRVMLLDITKNSFVMFSVAHLPEPERESMRQLFRANIQRT